MIFVHGYNNAEAVARESYSRAFTNSLSNVAHFFWPGDIRGGSGFSSLSYPWQIDSARTSAARLAGFLVNLTGPAGTPAEVSFVAHSLGCRLTVEICRILLDQGVPSPRIRFVALMAAALPMELVYIGEPLAAAARHPGTLAIFFSFDDQVLRLAFPAGQYAAFRLGIESGSYRRAVGRFGEPGSLTLHRFEMRLGHSEYWPTAPIASRIAGYLGSAVPRSLSARHTPAVAGPSAADTIPRRRMATRSILSRELSGT